MRVIHKQCHTHGRRWCIQCFLFTASFPVEHFVWEHWPLEVLAKLAGVH